MMLIFENRDIFMKYFKYKLNKNVKIELKNDFFSSNLYLLSSSIFFFVIFFIEGISSLNPFENI